MAIHHVARVTCSCAHTFEARVVRSINRRRSPEAVAAILEGSLHEVDCPSCGQTFRADVGFAYTDLDRGLVIRVLPSKRYFGWKGASHELQAAASDVEQCGLGAPCRRVVAGLDELREKILLHDHGISAHAFELLKLALIAEHPFLIRRRGLAIRLDALGSESATLVATHRHEKSAFELNLERTDFDALLSDAATHERALEAAGTAAFGPDDDDWIDLRRWSPESWALAALEYYARTFASGQPVDTGSGDFERMLGTLPRGGALPGYARDDLRTIANASAVDAALQDRLFEIRFDLELEDEWRTRGTATDITSLWEVLRALPDHHVMTRSSLREISIGTSRQDTNSWYGSREISIAEADVHGGADWFAGTVRHEIGHAVEHQYQQEVEDWLWTDVGWAWYDPTDEGIDLWIADLCPWDSYSGAERADIRRILRQCLGPGYETRPGAEPRLPRSHLWRSRGFGPRLVYEKSPASWWDYADQWHVVGDYAYFLNYYDPFLQIVHLDVLYAIDQIGAAYAGMSQSEFFAELYAAYKNPAGHSLDPYYTDWLDANL